MNKKHMPDGETLFKAIIENPQIIASLPATYKYDYDFLELYYIILEDKIAPYIPTEILKKLKINQFYHQKNKPNITLEDEEIILHNLLTDPKTLTKIPTNEKYNNQFLEMLYIIWGDKIKPYLPEEMFEELKNEDLMHQYHQNYNNNHLKWAEEENQKILTKRKPL